MTYMLQGDSEGITRAADLLRAGKLVAFGTETVYGLGADATNPQAVASIFKAKGRPRFNPLICHYPSASSAFRHVIADERAQLLGRAFWPGPLTLVLPRQPDCPVALLTGAGLDTLAVRVPGHVVALSLLRRVGYPIAAPSANRSGQVSPTSARHVLDGLAGRIDAILDSGPCKVGVEFHRARFERAGSAAVTSRRRDDRQPRGQHRPHSAEDASGRGSGASVSRPDGVALRADFASAVRCDVSRRRRGSLGVRTATVRWPMPVSTQRVRQVVGSRGAFVRGAALARCGRDAAGSEADRCHACSGERIGGRDQRPAPACGGAAERIARSPQGAPTSNRTFAAWIRGLCGRIDLLIVPKTVERDPQSVRLRRQPHAVTGACGARTLRQKSGVAPSCQRKPASTISGRIDPQDRHRHDGRLGFNRRRPSTNIRSSMNRTGCRRIST